MADPGFPRGRQPQRGRQHTVLPIFPEKEFLAQRRGREGRAPPLFATALVWMIKRGKQNIALPQIRQ